MTLPTVATLTARIRQAAAWRPAPRDTARIVKVRCPRCRVWRRPRQFHRLGGSCRKCMGTG
ncbi:hypothetical protein AB0M02_41090 [Actinoplanes sp. NPDC051861]|uniref:hypothetical protein n=1 Tax=Actinoplanes sp. NPDC051861 TaxID=3155170 RepID=UPI00342704D0